MNYQTIIKRIKLTSKYVLILLKMDKGYKLTVWHNY